MSAKKKTPSANFGVEIPRSQKSRTPLQRIRHDSEQLWGKASVELSLNFTESLR